MSIIRTDQWLEQPNNHPEIVAGKLKAYFNDQISSDDISEYLIMHGMYRKDVDNSLVQSLKRSNCWDLILLEEKRLKKLWKGPDIPIFIFPSDTSNRKMAVEHNGKSGLAFSDKLFLFLSDKNSKKEIQALFTHEYNHVCRLSNIKKGENEYTLLDTIILEGMAENAVRELVGKEYVASYVNYYSDNKLLQMWEKIIKPNMNIKRYNQKHNRILYGTGLYPKMAGYCVGFFLVKKYLEKKEITTTDIINLSAKRIIDEL